MHEIVIEYLPGLNGGEVPLLPPDERERLEALSASAKKSAFALGFDPESAEPNPPGSQEFIRALLLEGEIRNDDLLRSSRKDEIRSVCFTVRAILGRDKRDILALRRRALAKEEDAALWSVEEIRLLEAELCRQHLAPVRIDTGPAIGPDLEEILGFRCRALVFPDFAQERLFLSMRSSTPSEEATPSPPKSDTETPVSGSG